MDFLWWLAERRTEFFDLFFRFWTLFGEEALILVLLCVLFWCVDKKLAYKVGLTFFTAGLGVQTLKITFRIERPWVLDPSFPPVEEAVGTATGYSFPSGHVQSAVSVYGPAALHCKKIWVRILCPALMVLVALSRMYLGVHTPADVLAAFALSALCAVGAHFLLEACHGRRADAVIAIVMALLSIGAAVYSICLFRAGTIAFDYVSDCCKTAGAGLGFSAAWYFERQYINFSVRCKNFGMQLLKLVIGLAVVVGLKVGLKALLGESIPADMFRYFLMVVWGLLLYPLAIKRFFAAE